MKAAVLNLAIDGRPLVGNRTGIGVHTAEIAGRLRFDPPPLIATHAPIKDRQGIEHCRFSVLPARFGVLWQLFQFAGVAERANCDVVWGPHGTLPPNLRVPAVVSMHDLTSITAPHRHRLKTIWSFNLLIRESLERARYIAAVSNQTAEEIVRGFAIDREKITVVPNGVDSFFSPGSRVPVPRSYLLFVGTFEPRKGLDDLLAAWNAMGPQRPGLVIAGDPGWRSKRLRGRFAQEKDLTMAGFVDRVRLRELYRDALCLVYPSRHEGFGLPPLEAMACGTPVISSDGGALPEVVGDAALVFPAGDRPELLGALLRIVADQGLREDLRQRGLQRAAQFSWDRSASLMQELLLRAAGDL